MLETKIKEIIDPILKPVSMSIYEVETTQEFGEQVLRILIASDDEKMDLDKILEATRLISEVMDDNEDLIPGAYNLSIESAGAERKIKDAEQMMNTIGKRVYIEYKDPKAGKDKIEGDLLAFDGTTMTIEYRNRSQKAKEEVDYANVKFARTAVKF